MSAPEWSRVEEIFDVLLTRPPEDWDKVVTEECGNDEELRAEVESLLEHATHRDDYFGDLARRCGLPGSEDDPSNFRVRILAGGAGGRNLVPRILSKKPYACHLTLSEKPGFVASFTRKTWFLTSL